MKDQPQSGTESERWLQAQEYEMNWWKNYAHTFDTQYLEELAEYIPELLNRFRPVGDDSDLIEVGSGPVGIVPYMRGNKKVATDPLDDIFQQIDEFRTQRNERRNTGTVYLKAMGEELPFEEQSFDAYITDNVIDHVDSPLKLLSEAHRVLKPGGLVYLRLNVYHFWGFALRSLMEQMTIDKGHPHTFTKRKMDRLIKQAGFSIRYSRKAGFLAGWKRDLQRALRGDKKAFIQWLLCITRARYEMVLQAELQQER